MMLEEFIEIITSPAVIAACITTYVAYQQYRINRYRLKFDLYDRRLHIFRHVIKFTISICNHPSWIEPQAWHDSRLAELDENIQESIFLFDEEIYKYIKSIREESLEILTVSQLLAEKNLSQDDRNMYADKKAKKLIWLTNQLEVSQKKFGKYLNFKTLQ
ncbi:hypothetical protein NIES970_08370 [[Synechococcus] sp. NIES-970]|nr:hypothetical protein NIES970_08190 [[Synechococcus] sp. NIES-970]BAW95919.1 hypothetical protein NIES970_08370 [[Synechococcus] sp. NIES-970]